jgi:Met-10+ like-protein/Methyltransferase FkbM domain
LRTGSVGSGLLADSPRRNVRIPGEGMGRKKLRVNAIQRLLWHLRHEKSPWEWFVARVLFYSGAGRFFTFDCGTYRLRFFPSGVSLSKWHNPGYSRDEEQIIGGLLHRGETFVDVGANVGTMSLAAAAAVGPQGRVVAFEPNPRIYGYLQGNIRLNRCQQIDARCLAVGAESGTVHFSDDARDDQNKVLESGGTADIPGRIRVLKVDVEGYEKFVFLGAKATLARTDYIYFEVWDEHFQRLDYTTRELLLLLAQAGFSFFRITEKGERHPVPDDFVPPKCMNLLAVASLDTR